MKSPYDVLGVSYHADHEAVRAAFRKAAKAHHPDLNAGDEVDEESFRQIVAAYELLSDPQQRSAYDLHVRSRRRFGVTASVFAGLMTGAGLAAVVWLSKALDPSLQPRLPRMAMAKVAEPRDVAAFGDVGVGPEESTASQSAARASAITTDLTEDWLRHDQEPTNSKVASVAGADVETPLTPRASQWKQAKANGSTMALWVFVVRNPDIFEDEACRSELLQLIGAADDVRLLRALAMGANGAIAEHARQRLAHLAQAVVAQDAEVAGSLVSEGKAAPSSDPAFYLARCLRHLRRGSFDLAITDCDEAIRLEPAKAQAYGQRGKAWAGKGDTDRALDDYEAATRIDSDNPDLLREQGVLWRQHGDLDRALAAFDHAIRLGFSDASAYNERGQVWLQKGRHERAIADFNQALKIDPELMSALINRGIAWRGKGVLDRAIADFGQVIGMAPNLAAGYYNRGLARTEKHEIELAMADFAKAWELLPNTLSSAHLQ
jgi:tetratricopeptide (TPR) repeat protein